MKSTISLIVCGLSFILYYSSCKKNTDSSVSIPTTNTSEKVMVSLRPAGEFAINQLPIPGARLLSGNAGAKTVLDSTFYLAEVYNGNKTYAIGRFDRIDSIHFLLDPVSTYTIRLTAIERGTGPGLAYRILNDSRFYFDPLSDFIDNVMKYAPDTTGGLGLVYKAGTGQFATFPIDNFENVAFSYPYGELTAYSATITNFKVDAIQPIISMPLKRLAFGIRYTCPELTQGKLTINTGSSVWIPTKELYPNTIDSMLGIYSCLDFMITDTIPANWIFYNLTVRIVWELPDGRKFYLGKDSSRNFYTDLPYPRLNRILNVKVMLPSLDSSNEGNGSLGLKLEESPLTVNPPIRF
jgi:hypothetical protein